MIRPLRPFERTIGPLLFIIVSLIAVSCRSGSSQPENTPLTVHAERLVPIAAPTSYSYPGTIEGHRRITLSTKIMGQVSSFPLEEGSSVMQGQVIAKIRSGDLEAKRSQIQASKEEAAAAFRNIETNYKRMKALYERKSATQKEFDDITMAYDIAKSKVATTEQMDKEISDMLGYATITSPISGSIVAKFMQEGDMASPGMPIVAVEDARTLDVRLSVPESEVHLFKRGDRVIVNVDALGRDVKLSGIVDEVNQAGDPMTRQFHVKVRLSPSNEVALKSGMYATVILEAGETRSTIAVPASYLVRRGELDGVFTVDKANEALLRWVRTGKQLANGRVEILSGLSAGEFVVTSVDDRLRDGMTVVVAQ
jgi:RND family efflux transporter MFP subunit